MLALEDIKILELPVLAPGAFCTMLLGDLGAEVLKVESPTPNPFAGGGPSPKGEEKRKEAAYVPFNRNKKSIGLNLKSEKGRQIFYRLARQADVVIEGYRPGVVKSLGVDYETLNKLNPNIIYCSLSGYGQDGPYRTLPGHDINYISLAGALGLVGPREGPPVIPLNIIADFAGASLYGVTGILTALIARTKTGKGQYVDVAYTDGVLSLMTLFTKDYFFHGIVPKRKELMVQGTYPFYQVYETKDSKYISIGCVEKHFWERLCRLFGKEDYIPYTFFYSLQEPEDEKWEEISRCLKEIFLTKTRDEWFKLLIQEDIPASKVYSLDETFSDPHVLHRQMMIELEHPDLGKIKQVGIAPKLSDTPGKVRTLSPLLGDHTEEILQNLGYSGEDIGLWRQEGVIS